MLLSRVETGVAVTMSSFFTPFSRARAGNAWFSAGPCSSFPDLTTDHVGQLAEARPCGGDSGDSGEDTMRPGCKVFHVPKDDSAAATEVFLSSSDRPSEVGGLRDQVIVFQYKGKFHAINHECPHSSYPLSNGTPFDIEDFGIVWSSGITCPKHGWSFDLSSGRADRGNYKLQVWEVELRPASLPSAEQSVDMDQPKEVWVRRKQRMG